MSMGGSLPARFREASDRLSVPLPSERGVTYQHRWGRGRFGALTLKRPHV